MSRLTEYFSYVNASPKDLAFIRSQMTHLTIPASPDEDLPAGVLEEAEKIKKLRRAK